jgi:hypothetical protein
MHVDVNTGWKVHSLLRRSNKTQNTLLDYFGNFEEANRFIAFVREFINRDAVIRHRTEKESVLSGALPYTAHPPTSLLLGHSNISRRRFLEVAKSLIALGNELLRS